MYSINEMDVVVPFLTPVTLSPFEVIELTIEIDLHIICVYKLEGIPVIDHE